MAFLIYFFVLLVSAASVLFGLDLMNSPLPNTPNVPIGRSVQMAAQPPAQRQQKRVADERALTPVYPAAPGKPKPQTEMPAPAAQANQPTAAQHAEDKTAAGEPSPSASIATPAAPAQASAATVAQTATQQASNICNVQDCGAAYHTFRASDCSYQPAAGPRRTCTIGSVTAWRAPKQRARQAAGKDELHDIERIARRQPLQLSPYAGQTTGQGEMSETERIVRRMTRSESGDIPVQDSEGNIIIVRKAYR